VDGHELLSTTPLVDAHDPLAAKLPSGAINKKAINVTANNLMHLLLWLRAVINRA
jgi:hypothetical protein